MADLINIINFLKNTRIFWGFLSDSHLVNYAKIEDERGRSLMCDRTLANLLVWHMNY